MSIKLKEVTGTYVLEMNEELGFSELDKVAEEISKVKNEPKITVIDMSGLVFLSSLVIRDIVELWKKLKLAKFNTVIIGMNPTINEIFKTTGLTSVLTIMEGSVEEAIDKVNGK
jgi:anti-anti-sigma factor